MKPALVTGATGFLGWHVARLLAERGWPVRAFVRVEFWGDDAAAITDRHGRRYTDELNWPAKWDPLALAVLGIGAGVLALSLVVGQFRRARQR